MSVTLDSFFGFDQPSKKTEKQSSEKEDPIEKAARDLAFSLDRIKAKRPLEGWKKVVAKSLGRKRLHKKIFEEVVQKGISLGLFVKKTGKYEYLELPSSEGTKEEVFSEVVAKKPPSITKPKPAIEKEVPKEPEIFNPPQYLPCGHLNFVSDAKNKQAREEGRCCANNGVVSYTHLQGEWIRPVPQGFRRTVSKMNSGGWGGYCCDEKGLYIGGPFNDCRKTKNTPCGYHKKYKLG